MSVSGPFATAIAGPVAGPLTAPGIGGGAAIRALFANGEQGAWYDPSDMSTLFQDSAGTTPVTAVEQVVGKILDKSGNGNHASQSTTASKPKLSARKNLLTQTESLGTAPWSIANATITTGQAANAVGQMTLCKVMAPATAGAIVSQNTGAVGSSAGNTVRFLARKGSGATHCNSFGLYNVSTATLLSLFTVNYDTGVVTHSYGSGTTMTDLGGGLWEVIYTCTTGVATGNALQIYGGFTGDVETAGEFAYIGEFQLEHGPTATRYQRVTTATDYDTVGFPHRLEFDGVDDYLRTTFPNLGSNVTIGGCIPGTGASILTGQTIGAGNWDDSTSHCALVIIDRALTGPETALLTEYLNTRAGL